MACPFPDSEQAPTLVWVFFASGHSMLPRTCSLLSQVLFPFLFPLKNRFPSRDFHWVPFLASPSSRPDGWDSDLALLRSSCLVSRSIADRGAWRFISPRSPGVRDVAPSKGASSKCFALLHDPPSVATYSRARNLWAMMSPARPTWPAMSPLPPPILSSRHWCSLRRISSL